MKNRDIYDAALCLLDEPNDTLRLNDYVSRAPYILSGFYYENAALDDRYREISGQGARKTGLSVPSELDADFPLSESFVYAASNYLASMLVCDSDSELSDKLLKITAESLQKISSGFSEGDAGVCGQSHSIVNVYGSIT